MKLRKFMFPTQLCLVLFTGLLICGCKYEEPAGENGAGAKYVVQVAGSSTVAPVSEAVAEAFDNATKIKTNVATTGTGPGMEKLSRKECDVAGASRPIKQKEIESCKAAGIEPIELKIGLDGISIVVNPQNDWCDTLSVEQLKKLWEFESKVKTWKDLNPQWPDEEIKLFGPDKVSGTFDYFIEEIIGDVPENQSPCRTDYTQSVKDTMLVEGVKGNKYALGYFGFAYYVKNKDQLKALKIATKSDLSDSVAPTSETIENGTYKPLSRPLFIYVSRQALLAKPEVAEFVKFYLTEGQKQVSEVGYVRLPEETIKAAEKKVLDILAEGEKK